MSKTTELPGFDRVGFMKALEDLPKIHERTISNAKARSQSESSTNKGDASKPAKGQSSLTDAEWELYYGEGV